MLKSRLRRLTVPVAAAAALGLGLVGLTATSASAATHPFAVMAANVSENGTGTGYSAYINMHDASGNAISVGIQSDHGDTATKGTPFYIWERVQNGKFTYGYLAPASHGLKALKLNWYANGTAVFYTGSKRLATIPVTLKPRLFFNVEGNGRLNGDTVNDVFTNVNISVGNIPGKGGNHGLNGAWNTSSFNFHGLKATNTNGVKQGGANFTVTGRVSGLPRGGNWDNNEVAGIGMIAEYWAGH